MDEGNEADHALQVRAGFAAEKRKNCHSCWRRYDAPENLPIDHLRGCARCKAYSHWEWEGWQPEIWRSLKARGQVPK